MLVSPITLDHKVDSALVKLTNSVGVEVLMIKPCFKKFSLIEGSLREAIIAFR